MKLTFWGAARQVTGSMYLLELDDEYTILIDCGTDMERHLDEEEEAPQFFPFDASNVDLVLLTHAHIDHSGNIPNLYRDGYEGQVMCTTATLELAQLLLIDAAHLHARRLNKAQGDSNKKKKQMNRITRKGDVYLEKQVDEAVENFVTVPFNKRFRVKQGVDVTFIPAGHLLGAAHIVLEVEENGVKKSICFSGDLGRKNYPLLINPEPIPSVDYLLCESTYGSRRHEDQQTPEAALAEVVRRTCIDIPGRLIIPSFSVGRTQALLYTLNRLYTEQGFEPIKVFSDSPLARASTRVYERNIRLLNGEARRFKEEHDSLFDFENLQYVESEKASRAISGHSEPCIIISSSGMVAGGRVEQHVAANINNPYCTILLIGYCAEGTLGWRLLNGQSTLKIKDREVAVLAKIEKIDVFSGHGDIDDLLNFVKSQSTERLKKIFLIHGETTGMENFKTALGEAGYENVEIPMKGQAYQL
ncbi:MAG: MBL fold metallo-hydrolase [Cytophagaceae bacterium]|nr:MBL fold metallo-hydrolase [Cytophagaceae bacterium]